MREMGIGSETKDWTLASEMGVSGTGRQVCKALSCEDGTLRGVEAWIAPYREYCRIHVLCKGSAMGLMPSGDGKPTRKDGEVLHLSPRCPSEADIDALRRFDVLGGITIPPNIEKRPTAQFCAFIEALREEWEHTTAYIERILWGWLGIKGAGERPATLTLTDTVSRYRYRDGLQGMSKRAWYLPEKLRYWNIGSWRQE